MKRLIISLVVFVVYGCDETSTNLSSPPQWSTDAQLTLFAAETHVDLHWPEAQDDLGIEGYEVRLNGMTPIRLPSTIHSYRFDMLMTAQQYEVSVQAFDLDNQATEQLLKDIIYTVDQSAPTWLDPEITIQTVSSNRIEFTWSQSTDNVQVTEYYIYLDEQLIQRTDHLTNEMMIGNLRPAQTYLLTVEARDQEGYLSNDGPSLMVTTIDDQAPIWQEDARLFITAVTEEAVELTWEPAQDDVEVVQYELQLNQEDFQIIEGDQSSVVVPHLQPDTAYSFSLTAVDQSNNRSSVLEAVAHTADHQAPIWLPETVLRLDQISEDEALFSWRAAEDNGTLVGYEVIKNLTLVESVPMEQTSYVLSNLEPDQSYLIQIVAMDRLGNRSLPLELNVQTIDDEAPQWPLMGSLELVHTGETSAQVHWPAAYDNGNVTGYRVDVDGVTVYTGDSAQRYADLVNLTPGSSHFVSVYATDRLNQWGQALSIMLQTEDYTLPSWEAEQRLTIEVLSETRIEIHWPEASDNVEVAAYLIYVDEQLEGRTDAQTLQYTFEDLEPWTLYWLRVEAEDRQGNRSTVDLAEQARTGDETPPLLNQNLPLQAPVSTSEEILLTWGPASDNGQLAGYHLYMNNELIAELASNHTDYRVQTLSPGETYHFALEAFDEANNLSFRQNLVLNLPDGAPPYWPNSSQLMVSNNSDQSLTLSWTEAQDDVEVSTYHVYHQNILVESTLASTLTATIQDLALGEVHTFRIEAEDAAGYVSTDGPTLTLNLSDQTPPSFPEGTELTVSHIDPRSLTLSWAAATDNVSITAYRIEQDGLLLHRMIDGATSYTIHDLHPLTEYRFQVVAEDAVGHDSEPLTLSVTTPDLEAPRWPVEQEFIALMLQPDWVQLTWHFALGEVDHYILSDENAIVESIPGNINEWTISGLTPESNYTFSLSAVGPTGLGTESLLRVNISTPPDLPPTWPENASLRVIHQAETSITVEWDPLASEQYISHYILSLNGEFIDTVEPSIHQFQFTGLNLGEEYTLSVNAENIRAQLSDDSPSLTLRTQDVTPPTFSPDALLSVNEQSVSTLQLVWPSAFDNVAVVTYRIYVDDIPLVDLPSDVRSYRISSLQPGGEYLLRVTAFDEAGGESNLGLTATGYTRSGELIPTNEEVKTALEVHCSLCHETWFTSLAAFETQLLHGYSGDFAQARAVLDRRFVVPGDPQNSLLVELLEGRGPDEYDSPMMPPTGFGGASADFATLSANGQTTVTILQIRDWIEVMEEAP